MSEFTAVAAGFLLIASGFLAMIYAYAHEGRTMADIDRGALILVIGTVAVSLGIAGVLYPIWPS